MELDATQAEKQQLAYSTQFFDFTPELFIDNITWPAINVINENLDATKARIAAEFIGKVKQEDLDQSFDIIKEAYVSRANEVFDKFGRYVRKNILFIPQNVVLPEDRPHIHPEAKEYTGVALRKDMEKVTGLKKEILNAKYSKAILEAKLRNLEVVANRQQRLLEQVELLKLQRSEMVLLDGQLDILKSKLADLKPVLEAIENNIPDHETHDDSCNVESCSQLKRDMEEGDEIVAKKVNKENVEACKGLKRKTERRDEIVPPKINKEN